MSDVHSFARPEEARVTHLSLDLTPDFDRRVISGVVVVTVERSADAREVVLDQRGLVIDAVTDSGGHALAYAIGAGDELRGAPLVVQLPPKPLLSNTTKLTIRYRTSPDAPALQWLTAAQTASKKQPFLFTQGQAILTRTWIPLQDSPGIRITYDAKVHVPPGMRAVMSAELDDDKPEPGVAAFQMEQPIPGYLIALAVGDLEFRRLSERTGVWADPTVVAAAAYEFEDTEAMVQAAEQLYGPYRWERYDILVLPPSFPFGGMENPRLTFASSTVLAGDRSLVALIAHELAHSWSGNLVTNATWADIWLNEGTTVYFEDRIVERIYGKDAMEMNQLLSWQDLRASLAGSDPPDSRLWHAAVASEDPDDAISDVPYIKGSAFLRYLEGVVGRARFDAFLHAYFDKHAFQSMTTARFLEHVKKELARDDAELQSMHLDEWAYGAGLPPFAPTPASKLLQKIDDDLARLAQGDGPESLDIDSFNAQQWVHLLKHLPRKQSPEQMLALDEAWGLNRDGSKTSNNEVRFEWLRLVIENHDERSLPVLERYLRAIGRRKLVLPLYEALIATPWGREFAVRVFAEARAGYHPLTIEGVEELLANNTKATPP